MDIDSAFSSCSRLNSSKDSVSDDATDEGAELKAPLERAQTDGDGSDSESGGDVFRELKADDTADGETDGESL